MSAVHRGSGPRDPPPQTKNKKISQRFHLSGFMCGFDKMGADNVKGSGRRICLARPCGRVRSVRSAIQRAEKGSGLRTRSFQATQALQSGTHREPFYYLSVSLSNSTRNVKDAWQEPTNWSHLEHFKKKKKKGRTCALCRHSWSRAPFCWINVLKRPNKRATRSSSSPSQRLWQHYEY